MALYRKNVGLTEAKKLYLSRKASAICVQCGDVRARDGRVTCACCETSNSRSRKKAQPRRTITHKRNVALRKAGIVGPNGAKPISEICANPKCQKQFFHVLDRAKIFKYCSRECSETHMRHIGIWNTCPVCQKVHFKTKGEQGRLYCSRGCSAWSLIGAAKALKLLERIFYYRQCPECSKEFETLHCSNKPIRKYCSKECGRHRHNNRIRVGKPGSRAYGMNWYRITFEVCCRDNWTCMICLGDAPRALKGTYDDIAPEVDHIIMRKDGGTDNLYNLRCTHRKCNRDRNITDNI